MLSLCGLRTFVLPWPKLLHIYIYIYIYILAEAGDLLYRAPELLRGAWRPDRRVHGVLFKGLLFCVITVSGGTSCLRSTSHLRKRRPAPQTSGHSALASMSWQSGLCLSRGEVVQVWLRAAMGRHPVSQEVICHPATSTSKCQGDVHDFASFPVANSSRQSAAGRRRCASPKLKTSFWLTLVETAVDVACWTVRLPSLVVGNEPVFLCYA